MAEEKKKKSSGAIWWLVGAIFLGPMAINLAMDGLNNIVHTLSSGMASSSQGMKELLKSIIRFFLMLFLIAGVLKIFISGMKEMFKKKTSP